MQIFSNVGEWRRAFTIRVGEGRKREQRASLVFSYSCYVEDCSRELHRSGTAIIAKTVRAFAKALREAGFLPGKGWEAAATRESPRTRR